MIGLTRDAIFLSDWSASLARGNCARCENDNMSGSTSGMVNGGRGEPNACTEGCEYVPICFSVLRLARSKGGNDADGVLG